MHNFLSIGALSIKVMAHLPARASARPSPWWWRAVRFVGPFLVALGVLACGDDGGETSAAGGGGSAEGGSGPCGTFEDPFFLTVKDVEPLLDSTIPNEIIVHGFTVVKAPGFLKTLTFLIDPEEGHDAGNRAPAPVPFTVVQLGADLRYESEPVITWENAPATVRVNVGERYTLGDGCFFALPEPLFSYSVSAE